MTHKMKKKDKTTDLSVFSHWLLISIYHCLTFHADQPIYQPDSYKYM